MGNQSEIYFEDQTEQQNSLVYMMIHGIQRFNGEAEVGRNNMNQVKVEVKSATPTIFQLHLSPVTLLSTTFI
jgi:hypothetical protein